MRTRKVIERYRARTLFFWLCGMVFPSLFLRPPAAPVRYPKVFSICKTPIVSQEGANGAERLEFATRPDMDFLVARGELNSFYGIDQLRGGIFRAPSSEQPLDIDRRWRGQILHLPLIRNLDMGLAPRAGRQVLKHTANGGKRGFVAGEQIPVRSDEPAATWTDHANTVSDRHRLRKSRSRSRVRVQNKIDLECRGG